MKAYGACKLAEPDLRGYRGWRGYRGGHRSRGKSETKAHADRVLRSRGRREGRDEIAAQLLEQE